MGRPFPSLYDLQEQIQDLSHGIQIDYELVASRRIETHRACLWTRSLADREASDSVQVPLSLGSKARRNSSARAKRLELEIFW